MRDNEQTRLFVLALAAAVALAACGGGSTAGTAPRPQTQQAGGSPATPAPQPQPQKDYRNYYPPGTHKPSPGVAGVIWHWSDQLRAGHVKRAASYFALPAFVQNASPLLKLTTERQVLAFNQELPCGAHVVKIIAGQSYTVATFVLTERPGSPGCGATGKLAAAAFRVRDGKISEWRRVLVPPPLGPAENLGSVNPDAS